jgi:hypothetical protein
MPMVKDSFMKAQIIGLLLTCLLIVSCAGAEKPVQTAKKEQEVLYIHPDGTMEFKGRIMNEKDVVIYKDGRGGERAAVKLSLPLHPDVYRDTIKVERKEFDVQVVRE